MINIVHRNLHVGRIDSQTSDLVPNPFVWSRAEQPDADAVVYVNEYSHVSGRARQAGTKPRILFVAEPVVVHPPQYHRWSWRQFHRIISCNPLLAEESRRFHYLPVISYGYPFPSGHGFSGAPCNRAQLLSRRNAICQVVGAKHSLLSSELYTVRRDVAHWFHRHGSLPLNVYGRPAMHVPNYRGGTDDKLATMQQYRFSLCFENSYHPRWTRGYMTEKLLDSLQAEAVPIYMGCSNVEDYVPTDCFIDYRTLGNPAELDAFLKGLTTEDYVGYVERARSFLASYQPEEEHNARRLYQLIADLVENTSAGCRESALGPLPPDFLQSGVSLRDRLSFHLSCGILRRPGAARRLMRGHARLQRWTRRHGSDLEPERSSKLTQNNRGTSRDS